MKKSPNENFENKIEDKERYTKFTEFIFDKSLFKLLRIGTTSNNI